MQSLQLIQRCERIHGASLIFHLFFSYVTLVVLLRRRHHAVQAIIDSKKFRENVPPTLFHDALPPRPCCLRENNTTSRRTLVRVCLIKKYIAASFSACTAVRISSRDINIPEAGFTQCACAPRYYLP